MEAKLFVLSERSGAAAADRGSERDFVELFQPGWSVKLLRLNGGRRQAVRNSHQCQLSPHILFFFPLSNKTLSLFDSDGSVWSGLRACRPVRSIRPGLFTDSGKVGLIPARLTGELLSLSGFRFFFGIFGACLQGAFMSQGKLSFFFAMQPTSLSLIVCVTVCV